MPGGHGMPGGGPTVDTILSAPHAKPGGAVAGKVHLIGGSSAVEIRHVTIALMPRMDDGYGGQSAGPEVYRGALTRAFRLEAGQTRDLSFSIPLPYELPFTTVLGRELPGFTIGLCTEVDTVGVPDPGDVDPISVEPLESQQWVLAAIAQLGFKIRNVAFESAKLRGVSQQLPFYQEIQLAPPQQYRDRIGEVGLSFVASPGGLSFVLEADRRGGGAQSDDDAFGRFKIGHKEAAEADWAAQIGKWLDTAAARSRGPVQSPPAGHHGMAPVPPPGSQTPGAPLPGGPLPGGPLPGGAPGGAVPLPPPGPGSPLAPAAAHGQGGFPPPSPGQHGLPPVPGQGPAHMPPPAPGHSPVATPPPPGYGPAGTPPPPAPGYGPASAPPPPAPYGPAAHGTPPPAAPYPPAAHHAPPPPAPAYQVHHHHGGHHGHHPGWGGAAAAGGVAAAAVGAAGLAGAAYAAGAYPGQWNDPAGQAMEAAAGWAVGQAGHVAGQVIGDVASDVASDIAGEAAGLAGDILGGLLGGLFG